MLLLETEHITDLAIREWRLPLIHLPGDGNVRTVLLEELLRRDLGRDGRVRGVKDLEAQTGLHDAKVADLAQVSGIDVGPGVAFPRLGLVDYSLEEVILVWLEDVADAQGVDVILVTASKGPCCLLSADLGESVAVHWVDIVILFEWEGVIVAVALREADAVSCL